jgi:hypothetical protein
MGHKWIVEYLSDINGSWKEVIFSTLKDAEEECIELALAGFIVRMYLDVENSNVES